MSLCTVLAAWALATAVVVDVLVVVVVDGQIPIPRREVGFVYAHGQANASVHLDFYIDLICPDSDAAYPTMLQVADLYGPDQLRLTTHLFPLPYHRASFYATKGAHVLNEMSGGKKTYAWFSSIFENMLCLTNSKTHGISDATVVQLLATLAEGVLPGAGAVFQTKVDNSNVESDTRVAWKYACTRGVAATPTFMLNDVALPATPTWTLDDWKKTIDPLL